jgi:hypothetical protein
MRGMMTNHNARSTTQPATAGMRAMPQGVIGGSRAHTPREQT